MSDHWSAAPRTQIIVVATEIGFAAAEETIALLGGPVTRTDWPTAADTIADAATPLVVVIEAENVAADTLADHLPAIAAAGEARDLPMVISLSFDDIDLVTASISDPSVQLLCAPSPLDRLAALLGAMRASGVDRDPLVRESEREQLRHLHAEVARIAEALAALGRKIGPSGDAVDDRRGSYDSGPGVDMVDPFAIRQAIRARRLRDGFFPTGLFEDPAWDMLLDLFAAELEGNRVSVSSLCIAAAVAPTTALRWIGKLTEAALLQRVPDPHDKRRAFMALTDRARTAMRAYLGAISRAGLAIA